MCIRDRYQYVAVGCISLCFVTAYMNMAIRGLTKVLDYTTELQPVCTAWDMQENIIGVITSCSPCELSVICGFVCQLCLSLLDAVIRGLTRDAGCCFRFTTRWRCVVIFKQGSV